MRLFKLVILVLNILVSSCVPNQSINSINETAFRGNLSPECVLRYQRLFIKRDVPPRNYLYFHESLKKEQNDERGVIDTKFRIVGGKLISIRDAPYQVLYGMWCGGSLIAPEWVLTAAHCREKENYIYAGSTHRSKGIKYRICAHFTHPGWNMPNKEHGQDWDYQLLLLEKAVPVTLDSMPIALGSQEDIKPGQMVTITGWGHTQFKNSTMQELLHRVKVPIIAQEECMRSEFQSYHITPRMFCSGLLQGSKDSCQGDSGGPVVVNNHLIGSVSFGIGCAQAGKPGVNANALMARSWIRKITQLPL